MELKEKRFILDELTDVIRYHKLLIKTQTALYDIIEKKTEAIVNAGIAGVKRKDIVELDFCNKKNYIIMNEFTKVTSALHLLYRQIIFLGIDKEIDEDIHKFIKGVISAPSTEYMLAEKDGIAEFKDNQLRNSLFDAADLSIVEEDISSIYESIKEQYLDFKKKLADEKNKKTEAK